MNTSNSLIQISVKACSFIFLLASSLGLISCSKESNQQDPIVGDWYYSKTVEVMQDSSYQHFQVGESVSGELVFHADGRFSFSHYLHDGSDKHRYYYTTKGSWMQYKGNYSVQFDAVYEYTPRDTMVYKNHPAVIFKNHAHPDGMRLKLQSELGPGRSGAPSYFYREFGRLD